MPYEDLIWINYHTSISCVKQMTLPEHLGNTVIKNVEFKPTNITLLGQTFGHLSCQCMYTH